MSFPTHLYRLRSIDHLLGEFEELDRQTIFFCHPNDLNDPVEGFRDLYWAGDEIAWRNLFRHYALCLVHLISLRIYDYATKGKQDESDLDLLRGIVFRTPDDGFLFDAIRLIYDNVAAAFISERVVSEFLKAITSRPAVRRDELAHYFYALHPTAMSIAYREFRALGFPFPDLSSHPPPELGPIVSLAEMERLPGTPEEREKVLSGIFSGSGTLLRQLHLLNECRVEDRTVYRPFGAILAYFPENYVDALAKLVHPEWYVACFTANPTNSSLWGTYGDGHAGKQL